MSESQKSSPEFKVADHRRFNPDGSEKEAADGGQSSSSSQDPSPSTDTPSSKKESEPIKDLPAVTFPDFLLSLASSAQMALGLAPNPFTQTVEKNLPYAKQTIDLLGLIAEKTKGNLSKEEDQLLQVILADLRMRYLEEKK